MWTSGPISSQAPARSHRPVAHPEDADLAREKLGEEPSRWYLTGFIAPAPNSEMARRDDDDPTLQPELDNSTEGGSGEDKAAPESDSVTRRRFDPSSIGLSTTVTKDVTQIEALVDWGDYRAEPPLPEEVLAPDAQGERVRRDLAWCREPRQSRLAIPIKEGWSKPAPAGERRAAAAGRRLGPERVLPPLRHQVRR